MDTVAARLDRALREAGLSIVGVSIGDPAQKASWRVQPAGLQPAAQPIIDAFTIAEVPGRPTKVPGVYIGLVDADPTPTTDGDLWILRERFPSQRRTLKCQDGDVVRTLLTLDI